MPGERMLEKDLSGPVSEWLTEQGFDVYAEVPHYGSSIDLVGRSASLLVAVELKLCLSRKVIQQANLTAAACHRCYVGVASARPRPASIALCREIGLGIVSVVESRAIVQLESKEFSPFAGSVQRMREQLATLTRGGVGGVACQAGQGPAQEMERAIAAYRATHPRATYRELFAAIPNHYASAASMCGGMRQVRIRRAWKARHGRPGDQ